MEQRRFLILAGGGCDVSVVSCLSRRHLVHARLGHEGVAVESPATGGSSGAMGQGTEVMSALQSQLGPLRSPCGSLAPSPWPPIYHLPYPLCPPFVPPARALTEAGPHQCTYGSRSPPRCPTASPAANRAQDCCDGPHSLLRAGPTPTIAVPMARPGAGGAATSNHTLDPRFPEPAQIVVHARSNDDTQYYLAHTVPLCLETMIGFSPDSMHVPVRSEALLPRLQWKPGSITWNALEAVVFHF